MLIYLKYVPMGFYRLDDATKIQEISAYILSKEAALMELSRTWKTDDNSPTSARYQSYNFLGDDHLFLHSDPVPTLFRSFLKKNIDDFYQRLNWPIRKRWLQCWVNIHRKGHFLKMHNHRDCKLSGHLTVACEGTKTTYIHETYLELVNEPGLLTLIGNENFPHKTSEVTSDLPRISIAFDLYESDEKKRPHWVTIDE